jgi:hypothetical protein
LRYKVSLPGAYKLDHQWIKLIPVQCMEPPARDTVIETLIKGSRPPQNNHHRYGAPIHLMKLTRGILAACAGCWNEAGLPLPIKKEHIDSIVQTYWQYQLSSGGK